MNEFNYVDIDVNDNAGKKTIDLDRGVLFSKNKHIVEKAVVKIEKKKKVIKKIKKVIIKKKKPVIKLKTARNFNYVSYGVDAGGEIIAVVKVKDRNLFISVGDTVLGSVAEKVTAEIINIKGYHPIFLRKSEFSSSKTSIVKTKPVVNKDLRVVAVKTDLHKDKTVSLNGVNIQKQKPIYKPKKAFKQPKVLRSVVSDIINSPETIYNYIRLTQTKEGIAISPVNKYYYLFKKMGFKKGDVIVQVNQKNIKSKKLLVDLFNLSTAKTVNILLLNKGRYRKLTIDLLKIYNFL